MKCQEVDCILATSSQEVLTPKQKLAVDQHFASCPACRATWEAYRELAAMTIPKMRQSLRLRIAVALAACYPAGSRALPRPLIVGGVLVTGALAATVAFHSRDYFLESPQQLVQQVPAAPSVSSSHTESVPVAAGDVGSAGGGGEGRNATASTSEYALDRYSIVVLALPDPAVDPEVTAGFENCYDAVVRQLAEGGGVNVIAGEHVALFAGSDSSPVEIAGLLGAGNVLVLGANGRIACSAEHINAQTGEGYGGLLALGGPNSQPDRWRAFAVTLAERVRNIALKDPETVVAEAQATVLNTALGAYERARALLELREGRDPIQEAYDAGVVAAAIQIGLTAIDARARQVAWEGVRGVDDPDLIQPLLHSLANDAAEGVRQAAALALHHFVTEPEVATTLAVTAAEDPSGADPVGEAARRALMSDEELRERALRIVLDDTLPTVERLQALQGSIDGRGFPVRLSEEAAEAVFAIGESANNSRVRADAWFALRFAPPGHRNMDLMRTLVRDVVDHPDDIVRAQAALTLRSYNDDPDVQAALAQAQTDPAPSVRRAARAVLEGVGR